MENFDRSILRILGLAPMPILINLSVRVGNDLAGAGGAIVCLLMVIYRMLLMYHLAWASYQATRTMRGEKAALLVALCYYAIGELLWPLEKLMHARQSGKLSWLRLRTRQKRIAT